MVLQLALLLSLLLSPLWHIEYKGEGERESRIYAWLATGLLMPAVCPQAICGFHFDRSEMLALGTQIWVLFRR